MQLVVNLVTDYSHFDTLLKVVFGHLRSFWRVNRIAARQATRATAGGAIAIFNSAAIFSQCHHGRYYYQQRLAKFHVSCFDVCVILHVEAQATTLAPDIVHM